MNRILHYYFGRHAWGEQLSWSVLIRDGRMAMVGRRQCMLCPLEREEVILR